MKITGNLQTFIGTAFHLHIQDFDYLQSFQPPKQSLPDFSTLILKVEV